MARNDYYDISKDLKDFMAWVYIVIGGRGTGKTYGALKYVYQKKKKFLYVKRTIDDVNLLCGRGKLSEFEIDLSPYKPINRDIESNIKARLISDKGLGGFWEFEGADPVGDAIGYIIALSAVTRFKGYDLSECDYIIFDEFIPQPWERISKKEGEQILDLYKTVARDRELRGREPLKLIALANAVNVSNPLCNILEVTDHIVDMQAMSADIYYDRGIFVRLLQTAESFKRDDAKSLIYQAMHDTAWGRMAFDNEFAYDDLSNIKKINLKGYTCDSEIIFKSSVWYLYRKSGRYYLSNSRSESARRTYNLNLENDQKRFNIEKRIDLYDRCAQGKVVFESYTMYDVIMNYTKYFKL